MNQFCQDRDLLAVEGGLFAAPDRVAQRLLAGGDAAVAGAVLTAAGADFQAASVQAGMVVCISAVAGAQSETYEIVSVKSATSLEISVLRADAAASPVAPPPGGGLSFQVRTYAAQIRHVSQTLAEKLRRTAELAGIRSADFADSSQLRAAAACGALAAIYVARAENARADDANWVKAEHYRQRYASLQLQLRLVADVDGDGRAEQTRTLGNVRLRRS